MKKMRLGLSLIVFAIIALQCQLTFAGSEDLYHRQHYPVNASGVERQRWAGYPGVVEESGWQGTTTNGPKAEAANFILKRNPFKNASPRQSVEFDDWTYEPFGLSHIKRVIVDDDRLPVLNPHEWPHNVNLGIKANFERGCMLGTGTLVGPFHLLTAAHNVFEKNTKQWATTITVEIPISVSGRRLCAVREVVTLKTYVSTLNDNDDYALLYLAEPIGEEIGWLGISHVTDDARFINKFARLSGYPRNPKGAPAQKCNDSLTLYYHRNIITPYPDIFIYAIDATNGQSGSGLTMIDESDNIKVVGVHSGEELRGNQGIRINYQRLAHIDFWLQN